MSYGQPCRSNTTGPSVGPASAYPTFRTPASTCFSELNDVFGPDFLVFATVTCTSFSLSIDRLDPGRRMSRLDQEVGDVLDEPAGTGDVADGSKFGRPQGAAHHGLVDAARLAQPPGRDAPAVGIGEVETGAGSGMPFEFAG